MEEQADTEKTETERTDYKREHASHTQHIMPAWGKASTSATFDDVLLLDRSMYFWAHAVQTFVKWWMYFDTSQLPGFTSSNASTFLHFKDTTFEY